MTYPIVLPLNFVRPVSCGHFTFGDVRSVASFEGFTSSSFRVRFTFAGRGAGDSLLTEADGFNLRTFFGYDNVGFGRVVRCALWFVYTGDTDTFEK
jgi:hypothetical protein